MTPDARIYVAGHRGLAGSAIWRALEAAGHTNLIGRTHAELDLLDTPAVEKFFETETPEYIFIAAARVGGIKANSTLPAQFLFENLRIQNNLIDAAHRHVAGCARLDPAGPADDPGYTQTAFKLREFRAAIDAGAAFHRLGHLRAESGDGLAASAWLE